MDPALEGGGGAGGDADLEVAGLDGLESEDTAEQFGAAGAEEAGDTDDLPCPESEAGVEWFGMAAEVFD